VAQIHVALHEVGFFYIKGHGVSDDLQAKLFEIARRFFAAPLDTKLEIAMPKAGRAWRGYFPMNGELTSGRPDRKEGIYFGTELPSDDPRVRQGLPLHGANLWPSQAEFAQFKPLVLSYMNELTRLGHILMEGVALALGLERGYFRGRFREDPTTLFRIFNYAPHTWSESEDEWGVREHTDYGFLTILLQDQSGGLQARHRSGEWLEVPPIPGTFVINIGDMLELWTRGIFLSTPHRVRNSGSGERISLPFFFDPSWNAGLEPIDPTLLRPDDLTKAGGAGADRRWDGVKLGALPSSMTYGQYLTSKVARVFPELA
jgi:isopenicillin N synthase-like dioxygenase